MKNSKTPKIVVGVGLVAVYASIAGFYTLRGGQDSIVTQSPPSTAPTPTTADPSLAPPAFPELADTLASHDALAPEVSPPAATPAPIAPRVSSAVKVPEATRFLVAAAPKPQAEVMPVDRVATTTLPPRSDAEESSPSDSGSNPTSEAATAADTVASESATSPADAPFGKDSQITADVKSQVEVVAPGGAIDVTTRDGVVELAGSVPNQDAFDKAWLAARNVRDVRDVDTSALTISN